MSKETRACDNCGTAYQVNRNNLARGWGLCCSRSCAAILREKKKDQAGTPTDAADHEEFNDAWRAEMMKWRKGDLIDALHNAWKEQRELQAKLDFIGLNAGAFAFEMIKDEAHKPVPKFDTLSSQQKQDLLYGKVPKSPEYLAGYDAGLNGPDIQNSHFSHFSTPQKTSEWEAGKRDAEFKDVNS